jgi:hypothetical protein
MPVYDHQRAIGLVPAEHRKGVKYGPAIEFRGGFQWAD